MATDKELDQALVTAVRRVSEAGCHYRLEELATCYEPDLQIVIVDETGAIRRFDHAQNMAFFRSLRDAGAPPLNTAAEFRVAEVHAGTGHVVVIRQMDLGQGERQVVFSLMLRQGDDGVWRVFREHAVVQGPASDAGEP